MSNFKENVTKYGLGTTLLVMSGSALAQVNTADAVAGFTDVETAVIAVGAAMVGAAAAGIVYRWVTAYLLK